MRKVSTHNFDWSTVREEFENVDDNHQVAARELSPCRLTDRVTSCPKSMHRCGVLAGFVEGHGPAFLCVCVTFAAISVSGALPATSVPRAPLYADQVVELLRRRASSARVDSLRQGDNLGYRQLPSSFERFFPEDVS